MGGQSQQQQPVFYDSETGQYYTQNTPAQSVGRFMGNPNGGMNILGSMFGNGSERTYIGGLNNQSMIQAPEPYQYADVSLESLFPSLAQGNSALSGLLGGTSSGATGQASSGAGRFM